MMSPGSVLDLQMSPEIRIILRQSLSIIMESGEFLGKNVVFPTFPKGQRFWVRLVLCGSR
jgi:hypothetical protein